ncbi:hypothetical protein RB195_015238 [Necator americanus]|uniref:Uncharacterized protein n=1 Tax=Necator americanus TaxID=51031 RepID=A0ABR1E5E9_NECAM
MLNALERNANEWGTCSLHDGPGESSVGHGSMASSTSPTKLESILDDNGEGASGRDAGARTSSEGSPSKYLKAGHIMRRIDSIWAKRTLEWIPRDAERPQGRPPTRWGEVFATRVDRLRAHLDTNEGPCQRHSRNLRAS